MDAIRISGLLQTTAAVLVVGRLLQLKLGSRFPALLTWLIVTACGEFALISSHQRSDVYFRTWLIVAPVESFFGIMAVRELFALVFRDYPGIRSAGRWGMYTGLGVAASGSIVLANWFRRTTEHGSLLLFNAEVLQRSVVFSVAVVILSILFFLSRYPLRLDQNTYVFSSFFSAIFLSEALRLLVDSLELRLNNRGVDLAEAIFVSICMVLWASLIQHADTPVPERVRFSSLREEHLLEQLASLNHMLSRAGRQ